MSIEVSCPACQALLRIADENVGRKARCPSCSEVFTAEAPTSVEPQNVAGSPFNSPIPEPSQPNASWQGVEAPANPYAPTYSDAGPQPSGPAGKRIITIDEVLSKAWRIFKKHWVMICVAVLIVGAINFACSMFQNGVTAILTNAVGDEAITGIAQATMFLVFSVVQTWLQLGQTMVMLDVARGREINLSRLFAGGPYLVSAVIALIVLSAGIFAIVLFLIGIPLGVGLAIAQAPEGAAIGGIVGLLLAIVPIIYVSLAFSQIQPLIVDRNLGPLEALRMSYDITNGNKFTLFVLGLAMSLIAIGAFIVGLLMLCVGIFPAMIAVGGFGALVIAVAYLSMTDQAIVVPSEGQAPPTM